MLRIVLTIVGLVVAGASVAQESWPSFRGPEGTGRAVEGLPPGEGVIGLDLVWKRKVGSGYSGVAIAEDRLVTMMAAGERDVVVAFAANSGEEIWRFDLAPTYTGHDGSHDGPISTPAIAQGRVFAVSPWGRLVALDLSNGKEAWSLHLKEDLGIDPPFYGFGGSPAIAGGVLAFQPGGEGGSVVGFDTGTGEQLWRGLEGGRIGAQSPIAATLAEREQFVILSTNRLNGLDPRSGETLWELALEGDVGPKGAFSQSPMPIGDDKLLVKHREERSEIVRVSREGEALKAEILAESRGLTRSYSPPSAGGTALFGFTSLFLSAVDSGDGNLLWRSREPGDGFLVSVDDQLAVLTKKGSLHLGDASTAGWKETASLELFDDLAWTPPSFADGALYVRSLGELARVDLVRRSRAPQVAAQVTLPKALAGLQEKIAEGGDSKATIEAFLAQRELPIIDGDEVTFAWHGAAEDVAIAGEMIGMRREEPMNRLADTDLWWWSTRLEPQARISYLFYVDYEPTLDPSHQRRTLSTVLGPDMNWNRSDPMAISWFAMPGWPGLQADAAAVGSPGGRLESLELNIQQPTPEGGEAPAPIAVPMHVWLPPGYDQGDERYPVVYVLSRPAREVGQWPETLDQVVGKSVEPVIAVFPEAPRMRGFGGFLATQIVPQIDERFRTRAERSARATVGMGWESQTAAALNFQHPETFGKAGMQSVYMLESQMERFEGLIGEATGESLPLDIYLEWGRWDLISPHEEMNMRQSGRWAWDLLRSKGWQPQGGEVWDSTDYASWSNRTAVLLEALFPLGQGSGRLASWQTAAR